MDFKPTKSASSGQNATLMFTDPGCDVDDLLAFYENLVHVNENKKLVVVLGPSKKTPAAESLEYLHLNPSDPHLKHVEFVEYTEFMAHVHQHPMHYGAIQVLSPQSADLLDEKLAAMREAGIPNLTADAMVIQGNTPNIKNRFNTDTTGVAGVNLPGNEALIERFNTENKLMVVDTPQSAALRMTPGVFKQFSPTVQKTIIATTVYQMFSRVPQHLPFGPGLISSQIKTGANYNSIAALFELSQGTSLDAIPLEAITPHQANLAHDYVSKFNLTAFNFVQIADIHQKMARMVYALEAIVPGIWEGQESVFIGLDRKTIEQDKRFASVFPVLETLVAAGKVAFIPPMYDLKAVIAFDMALFQGGGRLENVPDDAVSRLVDDKVAGEFEGTLMDMNKRITEASAEKSAEENASKRACLADDMGVGSVAEVGLFKQPSTTEGVEPPHPAAAASTSTSPGV